MFVCFENRILSNAVIFTLQLTNVKDSRAVSSSIKFNEPLYKEYRKTKYRVYTFVNDSLSLVHHEKG